jgi:hypothetical protein
MIPAAPKKSGLSFHGEFDAREQSVIQKNLIFLAEAVVSGGKRLDKNGGFS